MDACLESLLGTGTLAPLSAFLSTQGLCSWSAAGRAWREMLPWREHWAALRLGRAWRLRRVSRWADRVLEDCCAFHVFTATCLKTNCIQGRGVRLQGRRLHLYPALSSPQCPLCGNEAITTACYFATHYYSATFPRPTPTAAYFFAYEETRISTPHLWFGCEGCIAGQFVKNAPFWDHLADHRPYVTYLSPSLAPSRGRDAVLAKRLARARGNMAAVPPKRLTVLGWGKYEKFYIPSPSSSVYGESSEESGEESGEESSEESDW